MKRYIIAILVLVSITEIMNLNADPNSKTDTSPENSSITAVNRFTGDRTSLVLQKDHVDLLAIPDTPQGIVPKLEDSCMRGNQLAVVMDYDFCFYYQLFELEGGTWTLKQKALFNAMNLSRQQRLLLVEMPDLTHAKLTFSKPGDNIFRKKGVVQPGDRQEIFKFSGDGTVLKNGNPYHYNSGREN